MPDKRIESSDTEMSFWDHFAALRPHLVRGAVAVVAVAVVAFLSKHFLIDTVLFGPKSADFPTNRLLLAAGQALSDLCDWINSWSGLSLSVNTEAFDVSNLDFRVINTQMAGQFNLHMKISMVTGLVLAMPYVLWEFWRFVRPALTPREIAATHRFVFWVSTFFFAGLLFGYFVLVPLSVSFFINYQASASIVNMIDVGQYLSTVIVASLASALVFQLPLLIYFLTRMGLNTKIIVTGDMTQIDLPPSQKSGLKDALGVLHGIKGIAKIEFDQQDIVRHKLVQRIVEAYEKRNRQDSAADES